ncbi:odorant-binding protein 2b isoform 1-T3 [Glossophaga mutica]
MLGGRGAPWAKCPRGQELRALKGRSVGSHAASSRTPGDPPVTERRALEMKVLVLTITCGLITALQALDPLSFTLEGQDITGTWYVKAMVATKALFKENRRKVVSPVKLDILEDGHLEASFTFWKNGQCRKGKMAIHRTEEPGKFSIFEGKKHVYIKPLPVKDHCIFYFEEQNLGRRIYVGKLVGKSLDENPEALEAFRKFVQSKGLPLENIFLPTEMENCAPKSD